MSEDTPGADSVGVTDYELAALAALHDTAPGRRALEAIGIAHLVDDPEAVRAGFAGLMVRDLAGLDAEQHIVADGPAAAIGTMLTNADDILLLMLTRDGLAFGRSVLVDAKIGGFLLDMTAFGVHAAQPLHLDTDLVGLVYQVLCDLADGHGPGVPFDATVSRFPVGGDVRTASVVVETELRWRLSDADELVDAPVAWASVREILGRSDSELASNARRASHA